VAPTEAADAVIWLSGRADSLPELPERVRWVQLPGAGVAPWLERIRNSGARFTSATGVYARPVASHALTLLLAGVGAVPVAARATTWQPHLGASLEGSTVAVVGA
jgi:phosphoglycerate dehydrogenase-like enzyme